MFYFGTRGVGCIEGGGGIGAILFIVVVFVSRALSVYTGAESLRSKGLLGVGWGQSYINIWLLNSNQRVIIESSASA